MLSTSAVLFVFVSMIVGIMTYMFVGAFNIWWKRNRTEITHRGSLPLFFVIFRFSISTIIVIIAVILLRQLMPYEITKSQGVLKSDGLYPIVSMDGYEGKLQLTDGIVQEGATLVVYTRKLSPSELVRASLEREIITEQLIEERARLNLSNSLNNLQKLTQIERIRSERLSKEENRSRQEWELESLTFKIDEQISQIEYVQKELDFAINAIEAGLISKNDYDRREQILTKEKLLLKELTSRFNFFQSSLKNNSTENKESATENLSENLNEALELAISNSDITPADIIIVNLERRLRELERLLSGKTQAPIVIESPWTGIIGYHNPSSVVSSGDLIGVLAKPDALFLEVLVPTSLLDDIESGVNIEITNKKLSDFGVTLSGKVQRIQPANPMQSMLDIRIQLRADLIHDIALNDEVNLTVSFINKRPNLFDSNVNFAQQLSLFNASVILAILIFILILIRKRGIENNNFVQKENMDIV